MIYKEISTRESNTQPREAHPYLITEDLGRWPVNKRLILVHAVYHQCPPTAHIVDRLVSQLFNSCGFNNDVKTVRVVFFELGPLGPWVLSVELNVLIRSIELLGNLRFNAFVCSECDLPCPIQFEQLGEDETGRSCTNQEDLDANGRIQFIESVNGTCSRFKKRCLFVGEIVDLV
jgi:hypothetical protein